MASVDFQIQAETALAQGRKLPNMHPSKDTTHERIREKAQEFEAMFISQMMRPMFEGLDSEPPFGGGPGEAMWRSLQIDEYGKTISRAGGIGIADSVMQEMLRVQEMQEVR